MSIALWLKERLGPQVRYVEGSLVQSGSPARYVLHAEAPIEKTISAIRALARRHVPLIVAKRQIEELMLGQRDVTADLPMLEDPAAFEEELRELGVRAIRELAAAEA